MTLTPEQIQAMLEQVPEEWRPLFACGPALGLRKGELFALRKSDVDLARGTVTVARSHDRNATKGGDPAVLPLPAPASWRATSIVVAGANTPCAPPTTSADTVRIA